jgi:hypothetical protein
MQLKLLYHNVFPPQSLYFPDIDVPSLLLALYCAMLPVRPLYRLYVTSHTRVWKPLTLYIHTRSLPAFHLPLMRTKASRAPYAPLQGNVRHVLFRPFCRWPLPNVVSLRLVGASFAQPREFHQVILDSVLEKLIPKALATSTADPGRLMLVALEFVQRFYVQNSRNSGAASVIILDSRRRL